MDKIPSSAGVTTPGDISGVSHLHTLQVVNHGLVFLRHPERASGLFDQTPPAPIGSEVVVLVSGVSTRFIYALGFHMQHQEKWGPGAARHFWLLHLLALYPEGFQPPTAVFYI